MTEVEYIKRRNVLRKELDKSIADVFKKKKTIEEHLNLRNTWLDFIKEAKTEDWFKHI